MDNAVKKRIRKSKEYVVQQVPYYKQLGVTADLSTPNFDEFPIITKDDLRRNPENFLTCRNGLVPEFTSGSTGFPLTLYKTKSEMMHLEAMLVRERKKAVKDFHKLKLIKFYAELHTGDNRCYEKIHRENQILYLSMLHMNPEDMASYADAIEAEATDGAWMMGPPSVISRFAQYLCDVGKKLHNIKFVEFTGELLSDYQRRITDQAFQCVVRNHYGCREFWCIAYECEYGRMHILQDHVYAENSEQGLLVSTLDQRTMPLIRYCVGDHCIVSHTDCPCGNPAPVLETFGGRTTDFIKTPDGREMSSILMYMIVVNMNLLFQNIVQHFKVVQTQLNSFEVYIVADSAQDITKKPQQYFCEQLTLLLGYEPSISFHYVDQIQVDPKTGKFKYFVSKLQ